MIDPVDKRIAELEKELAALRRQKLARLQSEIAALEASLTGGETPAPAPTAKGGKSAKKATKGWVADVLGASTESGPKKRGRRKGKFIPDEDALARLTKVIKAAGKNGISARQASASTGIFYPRAISLMDANFAKSGTGKWTRYNSK